MGWEETPGTVFEKNAAKALSANYNKEAIQSGSQRKNEDPY